MKRNKIIFGTAGIIAIAAVVVTSTSDLGKSVGLYQERDLSFIQNQSVDDYEKWIEARYIDQETGQKITAEKLTLIRKQIAKLPKSKAITFIEQGPDNIGGRTRAIQVDRTNNNRLWAGGVSGGLFISTDRANTWTRVESYANAGGNPYISSMTQTPDGTLFVATGSNQEAWNGNGVWYSQDFGDTWATVPGTSNCTEIVSSNADNYVWLATSSGLRKWKLGDPSLTTVPVTSGACTALKISVDGTVIVAALSSNKTFVSTDGGNNWMDKSGSGAGLVPTGSPRIEYSISPTKNSSNNYSLYAVRTNSNLLGMSVSHDNGNTWSQFVGASGTPSNLDIYRDQGTYNSILTVAPNDPEKILIGGIDIWQWKQTVNNPPSGGFEKLTEWFLSPSSPKYAHADNHEMKWDALNRLYLGNDGGIGITNDMGENWYPANRGYNVTQFYGIAFDTYGNVMGGAQDNGTLYNDHSLSTFQEFREVNGGDGFECEISFFNANVMFSTVYNNSLSRSGDRGQTWSSFVPTFPGTYDPAGTSGNFHPFHTEIFLAEYYDLNSEDSVTFIPTKNYAAGTAIKISSMSTGDSMTYVTPTALYFTDTLFYEPGLTVQDVSVVNEINGQTVFLGNYSWTPFPSASGTNPPTVGDSLMVDFPSGADTVVVQSLGTYDHYYATNPSTGQPFSMGVETELYNISWDTLRIQDPFQSWFLMYVNANGGELWGTRNALRLSVQNAGWVNIARGIGGGLYGSIDVEFSKDLNHCYISANTNGVWRLDGLGSVYTSDPNFAQKVGYIGTPVATPPTATTITKISTTNYEGLAVNPNNPDDVVLFPGFSGQMRRSLNATAGAPTWTSLTSITNPAVAVYDGIIDRNDPDILVVGTSNGAFVSEDGGASWQNSSAGFEGVPVYEVRQNWRTWDEGAKRPGEIYIGTFGRGIWSSAAYLGISDADGTPNNETFKTKLKTYPNPTTDNTTLTFNLSETSTVNVYVYSISGHLMKTITRKNMAAGAQTLTIDGDDLQKGTYIVKFIAGKQNDTVKFIKM
ncbi:MAG: T9SS type A sorting domain-containing protein [Bacteroidetes bacterium]|nr:MAG: T9SS type A sorting domain-containing protein [Bacteroidota bacterium]